MGEEAKVSIATLRAAAPTLLYVAFWVAGFWAFDLVGALFMFTAGFFPMGTSFDQIYWKALEWSHNTFYPALAFGAAGLYLLRRQRFRGTRLETVLLSALLLYFFSVGAGMLITLGGPLQAYAPFGGGDIELKDFGMVPSPPLVRFLAMVYCATFIVGGLAAMALLWRRPAAALRLAAILAVCSFAVNFYHFRLPGPYITWVQPGDRFFLPELADGGRPLSQGIAEARAASHHGEGAIYHADVIMPFYYAWYWQLVHLAALYTGLLAGLAGYSRARRLQPAPEGSTTT